MFTHHGRGTPPAGRPPLGGAAAHPPTPSSAYDQPRRTLSWLIIMALMSAALVLLPATSASAADPSAYHLATFNMDGMDLWTSDVAPMMAGQNQYDAIALQEVNIDSVPAAAVPTPPPTPPAPAPAPPPPPPEPVYSTRPASFPPLPPPTWNIVATRPTGQTRPAPAYRVTEYTWTPSGTPYYIYTLLWGLSAENQSLAFITRNRMDAANITNNLFVIPPQALTMIPPRRTTPAPADWGYALDSHPILGIRIQPPAPAPTAPPTPTDQGTIFWTSHARSTVGRIPVNQNDAANMVAAVADVTSQLPGPGAGQPPRYVFGGDFNRTPDGLDPYLPAGARRMNAQALSGPSSTIPTLVDVPTQFPRNGRPPLVLDYFITNEPVGVAGFRAEIVNPSRTDGSDHSAVGIGTNLRAAAIAPITSRANPNQCVDPIRATDGTIANGTRLHLATCDPKNVNQYWSMGTDNSLRIGNMCLDNNSAFTTDGNSIDLWTCPQTTPMAANAQWVALADGRILNPISGKCLDTTPAINPPTPPPNSGAGATGMSLRTCGWPNQVFDFAGATQPATGQITPMNAPGQCLQRTSQISHEGNTEYNIGTNACDGAVGSKDWTFNADGTLSDSSGACLSNDDHTRKTVGNLVITAAGGHPNFPCAMGIALTGDYWAATLDGRIVSAEDGLCLDSTPPTTTFHPPLPPNHAGMSVQVCTGADSQLWTVPRPAIGSQVTLRSQPDQCLDLTVPSGASVTNDTQLRLSGCGQNLDTQLWAFNANNTMTNGTHTPATATGFLPGDTLFNYWCLDNHNQVTTDGNPVALSACGLSAPDNEQWLPMPNGQILNPASGKCLDTTASPQNGMSLRACNGGPTQLFNVPGVPANTFGAITQKGQPGQCVQPYSYAATSVAASIKFAPCQPENSDQQWKIGADGSIQSSASKMCLDNSGASNVSGNVVGGYIPAQMCSQYLNEEWAVTPAGRIVNVGTLKCLDSTTATNEWGGPLPAGQASSMSLVTCSGVPSQLWDTPTASDDPAAAVTSGLIRSAGRPGDCLAPIANSDGTIPNGIALRVNTCPAPSDYSSTAPYWQISDGQIRNDFNTCLDNNSSGTHPGNQVTMWTCGADQPNQRFLVQSNGTIVNPATSMCLSHLSPTWNGSIPLPGTSGMMSLQPCQNADYFIPPVHNGTITLASDPHTCLDQTLITTQAEPCVPNEQAQDFSFNTNGTITLSPGITNTTCLTGAGTAVSGQTCKPKQLNQQWMTAGNQIINLASAQCLTLSSGPATMAPCTGSPAQTLTLPVTEGHIQQQGNQSACVDQSAGWSDTPIKSTCKNSDNNTTENYTYTTSGTITITTADENTGCLTTTPSGSNVLLYSCDDAADQVFRPTLKGLQNPASGLSLTIDIGHVSPLPWTGAANQFIKFTAFS